MAEKSYVHTLYVLLSRVLGELCDQPRESGVLVVADGTYFVDLDRSSWILLRDSAFKARRVVRGWNVPQSSRPELRESQALGIMRRSASSFSHPLIFC